MNMAEQCLRCPTDQVAIVDLTGAARRVTLGVLRDMIDRLARALLGSVKAEHRVGVLLSQSPWCAAAHLAIWTPCQWPLREK